MNLSTLDPVYKGETGFHENRKGGDAVDDFEELLRNERAAVERYVRFRLDAQSDADDVLQEVYLAAYQRFSQLRNRSSFKAWLLAIARNKLTDYFRAKAARSELPLDTLEEHPSAPESDPESPAVQETLERLCDKDRQMLRLTFWEELPQAEIARRLRLPVGTVKSRLYTAKRNFRSKYPRKIDLSKGESVMKKLPERMPAYKIEASPEPPFAVRWEELMGWFLVPRLGERLSWGMYDMPSRALTYAYDMEAVGRASVHGIEGVEVRAVGRGCDPTACSDPSDTGSETVFVAQLTDTHCRYLAALRTMDGVRSLATFLDGDAFLPNWGFGEDNIGNEVNLAPKGDIRRDGTSVTCAKKPFLLDIVGRYTVTIGGKRYDTVCVMDVETYNNGVVSEQFLDRHGRTVLWRRFNRDDWSPDSSGKRWSERLPENERLTVNGSVYVHWYDCITDYVL